MKRQRAFVGSVPQENAKVPPEPIGATIMVKLACWPLATVWLAGPVMLTAKSNPVPESGTVAGAATEEEVTVRAPVAEPPALG